MTHDSVARWLADYVAAWQSYDAQAIGRLFSADAEYRFHPWDEAVQGREAIVKDWLDHRDAPGTYMASYTPFVVEGNQAVAIGQSHYFEADGVTTTRLYDNAYLLKFNDERECTAFTEYYMKRPEMPKPAEG